MPMSMSVTVGSVASARAAAVLWSRMVGLILLNPRAVPATVDAHSSVPEPRHGCAAWRCLPLTLMALAAGGVPAQSDDSTWRDVESRIEYGYYTEDVIALRNLAETLAAGKFRGKLRDYYTGLLDWRLALLAATGAAPGLDAATLARRCVEALDAAVE